LALADIGAAIKPDDMHFARTRLLALENTFGGRVMPMEWQRAATDLARSRGLVTHLDGARLFNAAVAQAAATGHTPLVEARAIADLYDSVSVCFSKGLGAPVGSALVGSTALIDQARRHRKILGGGLRQAGVLAAAALHALDHHVDRFADDHARARRLAEGLAGLPGVAVTPPDTNIVFLDLAPSIDGAVVVRRAADQGVLLTGGQRLRLVTHLQVDGADIDRATAVLTGLLRA
jgi:threonine aldolase